MTLGQPVRDLRDRRVVVLPYAAPWTGPRWNELFGSSTWEEQLGGARANEERIARLEKMLPRFSGRRRQRAERELAERRGIRKTDVELQKVYSELRPALHETLGLSVVFQSREAGEP